MGFQEQRTSGVVDGLAALLAFDRAQPFAPQLRHGRRTTHDAKTVVNQPNQIIEVAVAVLRVAEPVADFLHNTYISARACASCGQ